MAPSLLEQAAAGRGLWIGLFAPALDACPHLVDGYVPDDPHCTLMHCGKYASADLVQFAREAAEVVSLEFPPIDARVGGVARFRGSDREGDPLVALLQHPTIRRAADRARLVLGSLLAPSAYAYDYTPHVTLRRVPRDGEHALVSLAPVSTRVMHLTRVGVVCGEAREYHDLQGAP